MKPAHRLAAVGVLAAVLVAGPRAHGGDKEVCVDAYVKAQRLRQDAKLRATREQLLVCARDACPASLRQDCIQWTAEVDAALPTVVIGATGPDGRDAVDVKVGVDGEIVASRLEGTALAVDPGVHTFHYEMEGAPPIEQRIVIRVGDKNRKLAVDFQGDKRRADTNSATPSAEGTGARPIPPLVYAAAAVTVVSAGLFAFFAIRTDSQVGALDDQRCKPNCAQSDIDAAKTSQKLGYVALALTAVSLGATVALFVTRPEKKPLPARSAIVPSIQAGPGGGALGVGARF